LRCEGIDLSPRCPLITGQKGEGSGGEVITIEGGGEPTPEEIEWVFNEADKAM